MNNVPADQRGVGAGMTATFMNAASVLSIGIFFSLIVAGLTHSLPSALYDGLTQQNVPSAAAASIARLPALGVLFAAFLGYNPMQQLLGSLSGHLPAANVTVMTGHSFFPRLITEPFHDGLVIAFLFAIAVSVIAAIASAFTGKPKVAAADVGSLAELSGVGGSAGAGGSAGVGGGESVAVGMEPPEAELAWAGAEEAGAVRADTGGADTAEAGAVRGGAEEAVVVLADEERSDVAIAGLVTRPDGAAAAGVTVTALDSANAVAGRTVTGADGRYLLPVPAPGDYVVVAAGLRAAARPVEAGADGDSPVLLMIGERA
jgi:hypothetical protein